MKHRIYFETEWIYPDSSTEGEEQVSLDCARNADACFQILTDCVLDAETPICVSFSLSTCRATVYQLLLAHVGENSAPLNFTTTDYESVQHFVTKKAPFDVYEITRPITDGKLCKGRVALYVRIDVPATACPGQYAERLCLQIGEETVSVPVNLRIYSTTVPTIANANFHMVNWIQFDRLAEQYGVTPYGEGYEAILRAYLENQLDMRSDYLMIPSGEPIRDADGRVVDFDFSNAEYVGNLALSMGYTAIMGGFSVRWIRWDEAQVGLLWDRSVDATSIEGYRQLSVYFRRAWECVQKNGWEERYFQCLEDEPQFQNSMEYRIVAGICRKWMPGIRIHDPVESTELGGAPDVWVVKQAVYEKYIEQYRELQKMGEEMWIYTCGFPAGATMNRIIDLPLTASLLPMWMCSKYGAKGFLHWGGHLHNPEREKETCYRTGEEGKCYPAGNSFVVYLGKDAPWYSVRGHLQRVGAYDYELLHLLSEKDRAGALSLIERVCRTFDDYTEDAALVAQTRRAILEALG